MAEAARPRRAAAVLAALAALALSAGCASDDAESGAGDGDSAIEAEVRPAGIPYEMSIRGVDDERLRGLLDQVSETRRLIDRPPSSLTRLQRRAEEDRANLQRALRSEGYYGATIDVGVDPDARPVAIVFDVDPGSIYRLADVTIEIEPSDAGVPLPSLEVLGIAPGTPVIAQTIIDAQAALVARAREQGYAFAEGNRSAVGNPGAATIDLTVRVETGPQVRFGPIEVTGTEDVEPSFVAGRLPWVEGELITPERLDEGRRALRETELFAAVEVELGESPDASGRVPVAVRVTERPHRAIEVGVRFRTDEGPGGNIAWLHRNFFGRGEQVRVELDGSTQIGGFLGVRLRKPDVWIRDLALLGDARLAYETPDAYTSRSARARVALERRFRKGMTLTGGIGFRAEQVDESNTDQDDSFGLVSLPLEFRWDRTDDRLDPSRGGRLTVENEPFVDTFGNDLQFNKAAIGYAHYLKVLDQPGIVLAGRTAVGSLVGASRSDIPANLRFYAGGGGSVRGFAYQNAGELDDENDPIGGRSLFEISGEIRARVSESIGVVAFVDAGSSFTSRLPDLSETLRVGAGPGIRYFSPIGPLRLDVAVPLNPRDSDDAFQLYVSVGQAF